MSKAKMDAKRELFRAMAAMSVFRVWTPVKMSEEDRRCGHCGLLWSQCLGNCQTP